MIAPARRGVQSPAVAIGSALALLAADLMATDGNGKLPTSVLLAVMLAVAVARIVSHWPRVIIGIVLVVLLIPSDGRYAVVGLPVKLEPYRLVIGVILLGWIGALLVDPRVRARRTGFEGPLALIVVAVLGSEVLNPHRVNAYSGYVIKSLWLFASFVLFLYLVVSVVRERAVVERILVVLVSAGSVVAVAAMAQRETGFNVFDHLHTLLPIFPFSQPASALSRAGHIRATASAGHPIELSDTMAMLVPLAAYLAISRGRRIWWCSTLLLVLGNLAGGSRTGIIGLLAVLAVFLWLRPHQVLKAWPAIVPLMIVVHFLAPGAIGGMLESFFPKEGLIAQEQQTFVGQGGQVIYTSRLSRFGPVLHSEYAQHNPLFGEGYGTRVTGETDPSRDNAMILDDQWLGTLLEVGILGVAGWLWLLVRVIRRLGARAKVERHAREGWLPVAIAAAIAAFTTSIATYDAFSFVQAVLLAYLIIACAAVVLWLPPETAASHEPTRS